MHRKSPTHPTLLHNFLILSYLALPILQAPCTLISPQYFLQAQHSVISLMCHTNGMDILFISHSALLTHCVLILLLPILFLASHALLIEVYWFIICLSVLWRNILSLRGWVVIHLVLFLLFMVSARVIKGYL